MNTILLNYVGIREEVYSFVNLALLNMVLRNSSLLEICSKSWVSLNFSTKRMCVVLFLFCCCFVMAASREELKMFMLTGIKCCWVRCKIHLTKSNEFMQTR